jgi:lysophospholipase L1-like esterase
MSISTFVLLPELSTLAGTTLEVPCSRFNHLAGEQPAANLINKLSFRTIRNRFTEIYSALFTQKILLCNSLRKMADAFTPLCMFLTSDRHNRNLRVRVALSLLMFAFASPASIAQITIMPMGDSITVGVDYLTNSSGGYRDPLYRDLNAAGVKFTFVGVANTSSTAALTAASDSYHSGFGGWHIQDLNNNLAGVAAPVAGGDSNQGGYILTGGGGTGRSSLTPNLILLEVGTNDLLQGSQTINQDLLTLVSHIHALTPNTTILVAGVTPINSSGFTASVAAYNSYIKNELVPSLSYTRYVDQNTMFLNADGSANGSLLGADLVHPNRYGYPILAQNWATAIKTLEGVTGTNYPLTVTSGTGSGSYPAGSVVTIYGNSPSSGTQFGSWTPSTTALINPYTSLTLYTTTAAATTLTANYTTSGSPVIHDGTYDIVSFFSGLSVAAAGTTNGSPAQQQTFVTAANQKWDLVNLGNNVVTLMLTGTQEALEVPASSASTLGGAVDVSAYTGGTDQQWTIVSSLGTTQIVNVGTGLALNVAGYSTSSGAQLLQYTVDLSNDLWDFFPVTAAQATYQLTVNNGTGGGHYAAGTTVDVSASAAPSGYAFAEWTGSIVGMASITAASTTIATSAAAATITATYTETPTYSLTVANGSGSGTYAAGSTVTITANAAASGYQFAGWTGSISALGNASSATTILTMPAATTSVSATYTQTSTASASTIVSVQFVGGGAAPLHGKLFDYTAGAGSYSSGHWNSELSTGNTTATQQLTVSTGLTNSTGAASAIGFQLTSSGAYYTGAGTGFTSSPSYPGYPGRLSGPGDAFLYAGFAYAGYSNQSPLKLTITGLNATHTYSLLAYVTPFEGFGNSQSATLAITGGSTYYIRTAGNLGTYQQALSTTAATPATGNYVEFDNLTGSSTQSLTMTNTSSLVGLSGFQIVDLGAASTTAAPSTVALTVNNGTGSGSYAAGTVVTVTANAAASGYQFSGWTGSTSILASANAATTTATISSAAASITATYTATSTTGSSSGTPSSIVGVQFVGGGAAPLHGNSYDYTAGASGFASGHWNPLLATGNTTTPQKLTVTSGLTDSTGALSSIGFTLASSGAYYTKAGTGFTSSPLYPGCPGETSGAGDAFLYAGFAYAGYSDKNPAVLTVNGLNATHTYSLLVYVTPFESFGNNQTATVAVSGGSTYYVITNGSAGAYQQSASTTASSPATGNYVKFDNLTGTSTQTITFTNTSSLVGISGFQIVDMTASSTSSTSASAVTPTPSSTVPAGYHLTFDDEFASLSISDVNGAGTKWYSHTVQCCLYDTSAPTTPTYMAGITSPTGENPFSLVGGGGLDIRLQKTNGAWYSGVIATVDGNGTGFAQQYGYFEMKAKFPASAGTWPAFWLLNSAARSSGANAGEIDVVESYMFAPNYINTTLHDWTPPATTPAYNLAKVADLSDGFHVFGMLWTQSTMTFYCDGAVIFTTPTPTIMNQPYYPIIDLGLGGGWPTNQTPAQSDMIVQYMRVYAS